MNKYVEVPLGDGGFSAVLASSYTYGATVALAKEQVKLARVMRKVRNIDLSRVEDADGANVRLQEQLQRVMSANLAAHVLGFRGDPETYQPFFRLDWPDLTEGGALDRRIRTLSQLFTEDVNALYKQFKALTGLTEDEEDALGK